MRPPATGTNSWRRRAIGIRRSRTWCMRTPTATSATSRPAASRCASPKTTSRARRPRPAGTRNTTGMASFRSRTCRTATTPPQAKSSRPTTRSCPTSYPYYITSEWDPPYRANRIKQLLDATPKHTRQSFERIQADTVSLQVREILPLLLKTKTADPEAQQVLRQLGQWDANMSAAGAEPLIVSAWLRELGRLIYADELGDMFDGAWEHRARFMYNVLANTQRTGTLVRRCEHAGKGNLRRAAAEGAQPGAGRSEAPLRRGPQTMALGRRALRPVRAPPFRPPAAAGEILRHPRALARRYLHHRRRPQYARQQDRALSPAATRHRCARSTICPTWTSRSTCTRPDSRATCFRRCTGIFPGPGRGSNTSRCR